MSFINIRTLRRAACLLSIVAGPAFSASASGPRSAPHDPLAPVPALHYDSSLAGYRPFSDDPIKPWKEANDNVGRIGGWRAYAREAAMPTVPAPAPASESKPGQPVRQDGQPGHKMGH